MLRQFLSSLFSGFAFNGELDSAREAGREHAQQVGSAYLDGFDSEMSRMFAARRQQFIGHDEPEVIEAESHVVSTRKAGRRSPR